MSQVNINATPSQHTLPFRAADFTTLTAALDYAAQGETGSNFYTGRGAIYASLSYSELRTQAIELAHQLLGLGLAKGARVALVARKADELETARALGVAVLSEDDWIALVGGG